MALPFDRPVFHDLDFFAGEGFADLLDLGPAVAQLLAPGGEVDLPDNFPDEVGGAPVFFPRGVSPAPSDEEDEEEQDEDWDDDEEEDSGYESLSEEEQEEEFEDQLRRIYEEVFGSSSSDLSDLAPPPTPPPAPGPAPASPALGASKRTRDEDSDDEEDPRSKRPRWTDQEDGPSTSAGTSGGFLRYFHLCLHLDDDDDD